MNKIERSQEYYQLLIDKFEKSGRSPRQKQVYEEIKALVGTCSSVEEIQSINEISVKLHITDLNPIIPTQLPQQLLVQFQHTW